MVGIHVPPESIDAHKKYIQNYSDMANSLQYYYLFVLTSDFDYYVKSTESVHEANLSGMEAYQLFDAILQKYSISCDEIDFCE